MLHLAVATRDQWPLPSLNLLFKNNSLNGQSSLPPLWDTNSRTQLPANYYFPTNLFMSYSASFICLSHQSYYHPLSCLHWIKALCVFKRFYFIVICLHIHGDINIYHFGRVVRINYCTSEGKLGHQPFGLPAQLWILLSLSQLGHANLSVTKTSIWMLAMKLISSNHWRNFVNFSKHLALILIHNTVVMGIRKKWKKCLWTWLL